MSTKKTLKKTTKTTRQRVGRKTITTTVTTEVVVEPAKLVNRIAFCLDFSGSMAHLRTGALKSFNGALQRIRDEAARTGQPTFVSLYSFGESSYESTRTYYRDVPIEQVRNLDSYAAVGGTPLLDAVGTATENFLRMGVANHASELESFVVIVITDGEENASKRYNYSNLATLMRQTQATDRWTYAFMLPRGYKADFVRTYGVPDGNCEEWEQNDAGITRLGVQTSSAISNYYQARSTGIRSVKNFYSVDLSKVKAADIRSLTDLAGRVKVLPVTKETPIRPFVEAKFGNYVAGSAYYQLTKPEKIQARKQVLIMEKGKASIYGGNEARTLIGIPLGQECRVKPLDLAKYDVFVQSTSVNRQLVRGTKLLVDTAQTTALTPTWDSDKYEAELRARGI